MLFSSSWPTKPVRRRRRRRRVQFYNIYCCRGISPPPPPCCLDDYFRYFSFFFPAYGSRSILAGRDTTKRIFSASKTRVLSRDPATARSSSARSVASGRRLRVVMTPRKGSSAKRFSRTYRRNRQPIKFEIRID